MAYHLMQLFYPGADLSPNPAVKPFIKEKLWPYQYLYFQDTFYQNS